MQNINTKQIIYFVKRVITHAIGTLVILLLISCIVAAVRVGLVIQHLHRAAALEPFNAQLVAKWAPPHPALASLVTRVQPVQEIATPRPSALENMLLSIPNALANIMLEHTDFIKLPSGIGETRQAQAPSAQPVTPAPRVDVPRRPTPPRTETIREPTPAAPESHDAPAPASEPEPEARPEPEEDTADPVQSNEMWATVITPSAPIYDTNGQLQKNIPPGSVVEVLQERSTTNGKVFIGNIHTPIGFFQGVIMREQDLQLYRGKALTETTREEREMASRKAEIRAAITVRMQEIETAHNNRNPYQRPYHDALRQYQEIRQEAQQLQARYDSSTGNTRITAGNRLREIRQEMANLTPPIRRLQEQRDRWAEENPLEPPPDPRQDAHIQELRRQLAELQSEAVVPR